MDFLMPFLMDSLIGESHASSSIACFAASPSCGRDLARSRKIPNYRNTWLCRGSLTKWDAGATPGITGILAKEMVCWGEGAEIASPLATTRTAMRGMANDSWQVLMNDYPGQIRLLSSLADRKIRRCWYRCSLPSAHHNRCSGFQELQCQHSAA